MVMNSGKSKKVFKMDNNQKLAESLQKLNSKNEKKNRRRKYLEKHMTKISKEIIENEKIKSDLEEQ